MRGVNVTGSPAGRRVELVIGCDGHRRSAGETRGRAFQWTEGLALEASELPTGGGLRWWAVCDGCSKRRAHLYRVRVRETDLPPKKHSTRKAAPDCAWRCREGAGLIYRSQQAGNTWPEAIRRFQVEDDRAGRRLFRSRLDEARRPAREAKRAQRAGMNP